MFEYEGEDQFTDGFDLAHELEMDRQAIEQERMYSEEQRISDNEANDYMNEGEYYDD